jgi:HK97 family phage major capsid protein
MSTLQKLGSISANIEATGRVSEFVQACKFLMLGRVDDAATMAQRARASDRVVEFIKSAQSAGQMGAGTWGSELVIAPLANAFLASLSGISAFDTLWPNMVQVPLRTKILSVSSTLTIGAIAEASIKPAKSLSLTASDLDPVKTAAFLAVSKELLKMGGSMVNALLERELRTAIARATNSIFLPILTASAASFVSSGVTEAAVRQDIRTLLANVSNGADSKLYLIVTRTIGEALAILGGPGGAAFPTATVDGGSIAGIPIVICDEATTGEIILVDASQVAAGSEGLAFDTSTQANIQLADPADSPPTASTLVQSLWDMNLVAIKVERYIGAKVLRSDCVAKITGVGYTGGSPA